mmetsp:Transcript_44576/g.118921  ORF Transcript_44576/g.118921 Transcript_44576/m.118921 type:complete len:95 (+) Transcript_44576:3-287(+)
MLMGMLPVLQHARQHLRLTGLSRVEFMKDPVPQDCDGHDVFCNALAEDSFPDLSEGVDGNREYHLSALMHPHEEMWNVHDDPLSDWLTGVSPIY